MPSPKPEQLRVLYLTANPEQNLRTDAEVRGVQDQVRRALHRDLITIDYRPAATSDDLIAGLNDLRPHVVNFSGHAGDAALLFDNGSVEAPEGRDVPYDLLARALNATDIAPVLVVLNGCDTLDGAEVLLGSTAVVVAPICWPVGWSPTRTVCASSPHSASVFLTSLLLDSCIPRRSVEVWLWPSTTSSPRP